MSSTDDLQERLVAIERDASMQLGWSGPSFQALRKDIRASDALKSAVRAQLSNIDDMVINRDHITRMRKDLLVRALED